MPWTQAAEIGASINLEAKTASPAAPSIKAERQEEEITMPVA
jgi:hypothetical protein